MTLQSGTLSKRPRSQNQGIPLHVSDVKLMKQSGSLRLSHVFAITVELQDIQKQRCAIE